MTRTERIELAANISILCTALLMVVLVAGKFVLPRQGGAERSEPTVGKSLTVPDVKWTAKRTIILALSTHCHFCAESGAFYQKLGTMAVRRNVPIYAVVGEAPEEGKKFLDGLGVSVTGVRHATLDSIHVSGTPTLLIVDSKGVVESSWVGKLTEREQADVLGKL